MANKTDVVVYGSLNMDFVSYCDHLPVEGETIAANEFLMSPGGKAANQAVACAKLGAKVAMVGRIGDDYLGNLMLENLVNDGVLTDLVLKTPGYQTGVAMVNVDSKGHNNIVTYKGANAHLSMEDVRKSKLLLREASAALLQLEMDKQVAEEIIKTANELDTFIVLNLAPVMALSDETLSMIDVLIINETEAEQLYGNSINSIKEVKVCCQNLYELGMNYLIITLGKDGAVLYYDGKFKHVKPPIVNVIDTTAAGDCFSAALTTFWLKFNDIELALENAVYASALSVTKKGAQPSLPTLKDVSHFLGKGATHG